MLGAPVEKLSAASIRRYGRVTSLDTRWHKMDLPPAERNHRIRGNGIVTDDTLMTLALMDVYSEEQRHLDAWDMAGGMVRPDLRLDPPLDPRDAARGHAARSRLLPRKMDLPASSAGQLRPPPGRHRQYGQLRRRHVHRADRHRGERLRSARRL